MTKRAGYVPQEKSTECFSCGVSSKEWTDYFCPVCGEFNATMYRNEHADAAVAKSLTLDEIRAEYDATDTPFMHNPDLASGADELAVVLGRSAIRR